MTSAQVVARYRGLISTIAKTQPGNFLMDSFGNGLEYYQSPESLPGHVYGGTHTQSPATSSRTVRSISPTTGCGFLVCAKVFNPMASSKVMFLPGWRISSDESPTST